MVDPGLAGVAPPVQCPKHPPTNAGRAACFGLLLQPCGWRLDDQAALFHDLDVRADAINGQTDTPGLHAPEDHQAGRVLGAVGAEQVAPFASGELAGNEYAAHLARVWRKALFDQSWWAVF